MQNVVKFYRQHTITREDGGVELHINSFPVITDDYGDQVRLSTLYGDDFQKIQDSLTKLVESRRITNPILINLIKAYSSVRDMFRSYHWPEGGVYVVPKQDATLVVDVLPNRLTKRVTGPFHIVVEGKSATSKGSKIV